MAGGVPSPSTGLGTPGTSFVQLLHAQDGPDPSPAGDRQWAQLPLHRALLPPDPGESSPRTKAGVPQRCSGEDRGCPNDLRSPNLRHWGLLGGGGHQSIRGAPNRGLENLRTRSWNHGREELGRNMSRSKRSWGRRSCQRLRARSRAKGAPACCVAWVVS